MKLTMLALVPVVIFNLTPALADESDYISPGTDGDHTFKLYVSRSHSYDVPDFNVVDWPKRPQVDSAVVDQIHGLRSEMPNWQGIHHVIPGASGSSL